MSNSIAVALNFLGVKVSIPKNEEEKLKVQEEKNRTEKKEYVDGRSNDENQDEENSEGGSSTLEEEDIPRRKLRDRLQINKPEKYCAIAGALITGREPLEPMTSESHGEWK